MRKALQRMLAISGFTTETFSSAEALLAVDATGRLRCLVLDLQLPGMSGFDLYRQLAAAEPPPPVIFITAYDNAAVRDQATEFGAIAYLPKPFAPESLIDALKRTSCSP